MFFVENPCKTFNPKQKRKHEILRKLTREYKFSFLLIVKHEKREKNLRFKRLCDTSSKIQHASNEAQNSSK